MEEEKLTDLIVVEIIQAFKWEVFLLDFFDHFLWQLLELPEGRHGLPPVKKKESDYLF